MNIVCLPVIRCKFNSNRKFYKDGEDDNKCVGGVVIDKLNAKLICTPYNACLMIICLL